MTPKRFEAIKARSKLTPGQKEYWLTNRPPGVDAALALVERCLREQYVGWLYELFKGHHILTIVTQLGCVIDTHKSVLRHGVDEIGWQFITTGHRWHSLLPVERQHDCFGIAPVVPLEVNTAYHATEKCRLGPIREKGLLPSNPSIIASDFPDTAGRIHVCPQLDCGREGATFWVKLLSERRGLSEGDYAILKVNLSLVPGARVHQDMHSTSGLVVDRVDRIPWEALSLV